MNGRKKRKLISSNDTEEDDAEDNIFSYSLDKLKALQQKIDSTFRDESIDIKGNANNIQIVVDSNTAVFELVKSVFQSSLQDQHLYVSRKMNKDKDKNIVATIFTVKNRKKSDKLYTANFFHTTSRIHVNAIKDVDLFVGHYSRLVNQIQPETIASLNEKVRSSCGNAMDSLKGKSAANRKSTQQQESHTHALDASAIPLPESSDCSLSDMMETSSPAHSGDTVSDTEESSTKCTSCKVLHKTLLDIVKKMNHMQQKIDSQERLIQESLGPGKLEATIKKQLGAYSSNLSRKEFQSNSSSTAQQTQSPTPSNITTQQWSTVVRQLQYNNPTSTTYQIKHTNPHHPPSYTNQPSTSKDSTTFSQLPSPMDTVEAGSPLPKSQRITPKHQTEFVGQNNIVVSIKQNCDIHTHFNQDKIRKAINVAYGPTIIELINKYGFKTSTPRIMIQFRSREIADNINSNWKSELFEGSTSRLSIDPEKHKENSVILKGIPLDASDADVQEDVKAVDELATTERLHKGGKKLRSFKVKFSESKYYQNAIANGINLRTVHILCHAEAMK